MTTALDRPILSHTTPVGVVVRPAGVPAPVAAKRSAPHVTTAKLQLSTKAAALVLRSARTSGPVFRDDAAALTGLSISTVNRQVSALLKAGLIR
ncbi:MAG: winged helix-turn-helix domain-containing protein, partial [Gordonia sp. (in: high G+C Gram-positive bacteria)]